MIISQPSTVESGGLAAANNLSDVASAAAACANIAAVRAAAPVISGPLIYADENIEIRLGTATESELYPTLELRSSTDSEGVSPLFRGYGSRGNIATPTASQSGDYLLALSAKGFGATEYSQHSNGSIELSAFANFTDTSKPVQFQIRLAPSGAISKKEIVRVRPDGALWVFAGGTELSAAPAMLNGAVPSLLVTKQAGYLDGGFSVASSTADERGTFLFYKARGTLASPTALQSGDMVGAVVGAGFDGASNMTGAGVFFVADGAVSTGVVPQAISLRTGSSSGTRTEALNLASTGYAKFRNRLGIGKAPSYALDIYEPTDASVRLRLANAGVGDTGTDGFEIVVTGSATSGEVNVLQRENAPLHFWTNATKQATLAANGDFSVLNGKLIVATTVTTALGVTWDLGAAAVVSPTAPNRTVRVKIAGVDYYLAAKTSND